MYRRCKVKRIILLISVLLLLVCAGTALLMSIRNQKPNLNPISFEATIIRIYSSNTLTVLRDDGLTYNIIIAQNTEICDSAEKKLKTADLSIGQRIKATVSPIVIQEPVETFGQCYQIKVLR